MKMLILLGVVIGVAVAIVGDVVAANDCYNPASENVCTTECLLDASTDKMTNCQEKYRKAIQCDSGLGIKLETKCGQRFEGANCSVNKLLQCGTGSYGTGACGD